jgi:hypothetical protein
MNAVRFAASAGDRPFICRSRKSDRVAGGSVIDAEPMDALVTDRVAVAPDAAAVAAATGRADEAR